MSSQLPINSESTDESGNITENNSSEFEKFSLPKKVLKALKELGYQSPTPIQRQSIPFSIDGQDLIGQAQTGTGKTAAFALPALSLLDSCLDKNQNSTQIPTKILVLTPTRELALQVTNSFKEYAKYLDNFKILSVYGGQDFRDQLNKLKKGVSVIVGTPGRVIDHINRGTIKLDNLKYLVLDEADEMLRMGFLDDVEWIVEQTPENRQTVLFSATLSDSIKQIAKKYLKNPKEVLIKSENKEAKNIKQTFWPVSYHHKADALERILLQSSHDGMIVFVKTKKQTLELKDELDLRGYPATFLSGDIKQSQREQTNRDFKKGKFNILIATDVAARGLDIDRISHVINFDAPFDVETYIHRIGRTGRAGRQGAAVLFLSPKEKKFLKILEKQTKQKIEMFRMPSVQEINERRVEQFKKQITQTLVKQKDKTEKTESFELFGQLVKEYQKENNVSAADVATALMQMFQTNKPLLINSKAKDLKPAEFSDRGSSNKPGRRRFSSGKPSKFSPKNKPNQDRKFGRRKSSKSGQKQYR